MGRVLVLGDDARSCLSIVRSLGREGVSVTLGIQDVGSIAAQSRYVTDTVLLPNSSGDIDAWLNSVVGLLAERTFDLVIPTSDASLIPIVRSRSQLENLAKFAVPDDYGFLHTHQKHLTLRLAEDLQVPIPRTHLVENELDVGAVAASPELIYPLIVKPDSSRVWKGGRGLDQKVRLAHTEAELRELCTSILNASPVLVQSYFQGVGVGQEFLLEKGEVLRAFQHQRVHEPMGGGGSSYRQSVAVNAEMLACSKLMLANLKWTGVAMVEYKFCPETGAFVLMEINGRFWGSLPLCLASGANFPADLYRLMVLGQRPTAAGNKIGVRCRNLLSDLKWFWRNWNASGCGGYSNAVPRGKAIRDMARILDPREHLDTITCDDPIPGLVEISRVVPLTIHAAAGIVRRRILSTRAKLGVLGNAQRRDFMAALIGTRELIFVCKGNICRSPFAEAYARMKFAEAGVSELSVSSSGLFPEVDRSAPLDAVCTAEEFGVNLSSHRSRLLAADDIGNTTIVLCMDYRNYSKLRAQFPQLRGRLYFLRPFDHRAKDLEIRDPWSLPPDVFRKSYQEIAASVDEIVRLVTR